MFRVPLLPSPAWNINLSILMNVNQGQSHLLPFEDELKQRIKRETGDNPREPTHKPHPQLNSLRTRICELWEEQLLPNQLVQLRPQGDIVVLVNAKPVTYKGPQVDESLQAFL